MPSHLQITSYLTTTLRKPACKICLPGIFTQQDLKWKKNFFNERAFFSEIITEHRESQRFLRKRKQCFYLTCSKLNTPPCDSQVQSTFTPLRNSFFCFDKVIMVDYYTRTYLLKYFSVFFFFSTSFWCYFTILKPESLFSEPLSPYSRNAAGFHTNKGGKGQFNINFCLHTSDRPL